MRYLILVLFIVSCAPSKVVYTPVEPSKVSKIPKYSITEQLELIPKPTAPKKEYVQRRNNELVLSDEESSTHVMFSWEEVKKINALKDLAINYKKLILEQENVVNSYIEQFNAVTELYKLEVEKSNTYQSMWVESENAYRQEVYLHKWDNGINRVGMYTITIGSIVVLLLAL